MKLRFQTRYNTVAAYVVIVFVLCLLVGAAVFRIDEIWGYAQKILSTLSPVVWGLAIAYLLNPLMLFFEKLLKKLICRKKPHDKLVRATSILLCITLMLALVVGIVCAVLPEIIKSLKSILVLLPDYLNNLKNFLNNFLTSYVEKNPDLETYFDNSFSNVQDYVLGVAAQYQPKLENILAKDGVLANVTSGAYSFLIGLKDFCLGIIVSVYLLFSKETFIAQMKKVAHALFSRSKCEQILRVSGQANHTFMHFLSGKALDSFIIGMLCFIGLTVLDMPYVVLISIIIGVTNMIPFFGPFIGAVPSGLLILLSQPNKAIPFVIFILLLQQFDGNLLGPKILGSSLGLSPFWIMFAIFLGGGLFGFAGMLLFVPLFAFLYALFKESMETRLTKKHLPLSSACYTGDGTIAPHPPEAIPDGEPQTSPEFNSDKEEPEHDS